MGYDISIVDPVTGATLTASNHQIHGGTYAVGGIDYLWTHETYNYSPCFRKALGGDGINNLDGLQAADAIPQIVNALPKLQDNTDKDYWEPTEGNAKQALYRILALCKMRPDGIVEII